MSNAKLSKRMFIFVVSCLIAALFVQAAAAEQHLERVKISVPAKSLVFLPEYIGVEKGLYKKEGIDLEVMVLKPSAGIAALISGDVPYTGTLGSSLRAAVTAGADIKIVMVTLDNLAFSLFGGKDVKSVADLQGKVVMVTNSGATDHYALMKILEIRGLDPRRAVNVVSSSTTANSYSGLLTGAAQGAVLSPPYSQMAEKEGFNRLEDAIKVLKRANSGISVTGKYLKNNPEQVRKVLRGTLSSMDYIRENREETIAFISKFWDLEPAMAAGAYDDIVRLIPEDGTMDLGSFAEEIQEINSEFKGDVTDVVDFSVVKSLRSPRAR